MPSLTEITQTSCSGCALSVTRTLGAWARNRMLANVEGPYSAWAERDETANERALRQSGALLCGGFKRGKTGALEHVKPKTRGMKSVWIERDSRNWCFMRFVSCTAGCRQGVLTGSGRHGTIRASTPCSTHRILAFKCCLGLYHRPHHLITKSQSG